MARQAYSAFAEMRMACSSAFSEPEASATAEPKTVADASGSDEPSNAAAPLVLDDVQAALLLAAAGPAPVALVAVGADRGGAGAAADARVTAVVQRVVRDVVVQDELPDVLARPVEQGVDLHQV